MAFKLASQHAFRQAYLAAAPVVLEPQMNVEVSLIPEGNCVMTRVLQWSDLMNEDLITLSLIGGSGSN